MKKLKLVESYSKAFYLLASQESCVDNVLKDCKVLLSLLNSDKAFVSFFTPEVASVEEQKKALELIFSKSTFQEITKKLLFLLLDNRRFFLLSDIARHLFVLEDEHNKVLKGQVVSVIALSDKDKKQLEASLVDKFKANISLEYKEDITLAEGFVVRIAGHTFNTSFNSKMDNLNKHIKRNISF